ncbi:GNAT family N-acetyltransferase [Chloroflexi bacterium TSY]|nr:GNAT family N-acetyltransferase [Chloroflexi bacterium TSY]
MSEQIYVNGTSHQAIQQGKEMIEQFLNALVAKNTALFDSILHPDGMLRLHRWDGLQMHCAYKRMVDAIATELAAWPDPTIEIFHIIGDSEQVAAKFRIQATEDQRYVEHNRSAFFSFQDGQIHAIDIYCPEPIPSAHRNGWIAPATLSEDELNQIFAEGFYTADPMTDSPPSHISVFRSLGQAGSVSDDTHPAGNYFYGAHWTADEADAQIERVIESYRQRDAGFSWIVGPTDTPADLPQRLEAHGLVLARGIGNLALTGLDNIDQIPTNPALDIRQIDDPDDPALDDYMMIGATCFHRTLEQTERVKSMVIKNMIDPDKQDTHRRFIAYMDGSPAGFAALLLKCGVAYLGGAATMPDFRCQRIYSTLLRQRLEHARARQYEVSTINAGPMSRRVLVKYGFQESCKEHIYAWMPVIDMGVINSLIPDE